MYHHIVQNGGRRQHEPPVEGERAFGAAASPAGFLVADGDAAETSARKRQKIGGPLWEIFLCGVDIALFQSCALCFRQIGDGAVFPLPDSLQIMGDDPVLFVQQKTADLRFGSANGQPEGDCSLRGDADSAGFTAAVNYLVGEFV